MDSIKIEDARRVQVPFLKESGYQKLNSQFAKKFRLCLIGTDSDNGTHFRKRQVSQACSTFFSKRQNVWQTLERYSILDLQLQNSENEATLLTLLRVIGNFILCCQAPDSSSHFSTGNLIFAFFNWKPHLRQDKSEAFCLEVPCVSVSAQSIPFSEFGRFEITNQTYP